PGYALNYFNVNDPVYNAMVEEVLATMDPAKRMEKYKEAAQYLLSQHWGMPFILQYKYNVWQPWVKSYYGGAVALSFCGVGDIFARLWIDQDLKAEMGY
ncbi:unnamed protein product, partial [marine sediment metagenome]